jgi:hypothetical protein
MEYKKELPRTPFGFDKEHSMKMFEAFALIWNNNKIRIRKKY